MLISFEKTSKNYLVPAHESMGDVAMLSVLCGNKMPTRCNRSFYCRSYCLLNMFRAPLCPSSGAQEYYTVVAACGISCCGFQVAVLMWSWGLCVRFAGCCWLPPVVFRAVVFKLLVWCGAEGYVQTGHIPLSSTPERQLKNHSTKYHRQQPLYNTLELLMMGIVVPETCWASYKICNKKTLLHLVGILFPHIKDDARSKPHQSCKYCF